MKLLPLPAATKATLLPRLRTWLGWPPAGEPAGGQYAAGRLEAEVDPLNGEADASLRRTVFGRVQVIGRRKNIVPRAEQQPDAGEALACAEPEAPPDRERGRGPIAELVPAAPMPTPTPACR